MIAVDAVVVTAMAEEAEPFLARADFVGAPTQVGRAVHRVVSLGGHGVLLVVCGIGLVNAAAAAAVAVTSTAPRTLISAGSAGGLGAEVRVRDVVVGTSYVYSGADARAFGYELGQVPGMPAVFDADAQLVEAMLAVRPEGQRVLAGTMLSGDAFIDPSGVDRVRTAFPHALSTDMESAALAHVAHLYDVPFVSVRGISDLCGPADEFNQHVDDAADRSAAVVVGALQRIAALV
ncbi:5'-methylthioadenosine/S-adenosylhomocysteine nucleosidase [Cellulomonas sp. T2.31MG-18]|uniref:5'-methylthioadenosine/S-adenosylhomocysteine nucleosidase n=1 Tax=Cellulomonas sp. T2.31MG-18 TaxID=3157619 RepID=UPI0035E765DA